MTALWLHNVARKPRGPDDDAGDDPSAALGRAMPLEVGQYVGDFVARRKLVAFAAALGWTVVTLLGWLLLWALIDRLAPLPPRLRIGLLAGDALIVVGLLLRPFVGLVRGRRATDWAGAAAGIESREPAFGQRLVTVMTQLLSPPRLRGSAQMLDHLVGEVAAMARGRRGGSLVSVAPTRRAWLAAAGAFCVVVLLSFWPWLDLPALLLRQVQPTARIAAVTTTRLTVEPGNVSVIEGQSVRINVRADRLPAGDAEAVSIELSRDGDTWTPQSMTPTGAGANASASGDGRYGFTLGPLDRDCRYRVTGGDARSGIYTVRVLRRPAVLHYRMRLEYPPDLVRNGAAASASPTTLTNTDGRISAPVGTEVTLGIEASQPLRAAAAVFLNPTGAGGGGGAAKRIRATPTSTPEVREVRFTVRESGTYRVELTSQQGVRGVSADMTIHAIRDYAPQAGPDAVDLPGYEDALEAYARALRGAGDMPAKPSR